MNQGLRSLQVGLIAWLLSGAVLPPAIGKKSSTGNGNESIASCSTRVRWWEVMSVGAMVTTCALLQMLGEGWGEGRVQGAMSLLILVT